MQDQAWIIVFLQQSSLTQAKQEAFASLEVLRASKRLAEAQKILEKKTLHYVNETLCCPNIGCRL